MEPVSTAKAAGPDRLDPPSSDPLLRLLFPALATGVEWGLERTERALDALGNPHRSYRSLHVGGTNGKGSVTASLASVFRQRSGLMVGCYTSPHLCSFHERILVDGRPVPEPTLIATADETRDVVTRFGLTFFEAVTVLAFHVFAREGVQVAAVEVGLGGRLDATNVLSPEVSAVTNVAIDHTEYLGDTLAEIAREKAGVMKPGVPFVTGETDPALLDIFSERARAIEAPLHSVGMHRVQDVVVASDHTAFRLATRSWGELEVVTQLVGRHQATNTAVAVEMLEHVPDELKPSASELLEGIRAVRHRGRNEIRVIDGRTWLFDVAHNSAGVLSLADTLDGLELPRPRVALVGVLADKDWRGMLPPILARVDAVVLTVPPSAPADRRWDPAVAAAELGGGVPVVAREGFSDALAEAAARAPNGTVVVTGSVHTVGSAMRALGVDPLG